MSPPTSPGRSRAEADPVPAAADHLPEGADREALLLLGRRHRSPLEEPVRGGPPLPRQAHEDRRAAIGRPRPLERPAVDREPHASRVALAQHVVEGGVEERLEVEAQPRLEVAAVEQRREGVAQVQADRRAPLVHPARRVHPLPGRLVPRREAPAGRHVHGGASCLGENGLRDEQAELDPDPGEADALPARLGARRQVVVAREVAPAHPAPVVDEHHGARGRVREDAHVRRSRVERVRDDLGQDRLLDRVGISVAEVFEQVLQVDARLAHWR